VSPNAAPGKPGKKGKVLVNEKVLLLGRKVFRDTGIIFRMARRKLRQSFVLTIFLGPSTLHGRLGGNYYLPIIAFDGDLMVGLIIKTQRTSKVDTFNGDSL